MPPPRTSRGRPAPPSRGRRVLIGALALLVGIPAAALGLLVSLPVPVDSEGARNTAGPSGSGGLHRKWPDMLQRPDNSLTDPRFVRRAALGRLLYYDPVLSGKNDMSCATCHHPDLGYADGRGKAMGEGGKGVGPDRTGGRAIRRGAPTIWNAAFNAAQFWDGRSRDLEDQARNPITAPEEMGENANTVGTEVATVPEYQSLFDEAFGGHMGSSINLDNIVKAIAAFERTQLSMRSPFDRYAKGDRGALTVSQRRGFDAFPSSRIQLETE